MREDRCVPSLHTAGHTERLIRFVVTIIVVAVGQAVILLITVLYEQCIYEQNGK